VNIPVDYILQNIYSFCKRPYYKKNEGIYNAECNVCKEGSSAGSKRRLFYFPSEHYFYCFNCNRSWSEIEWLCTATNMSAADLLREVRQFIPDACSDYVLRSNDQGCTKRAEYFLPDGCIDICDSKQVSYYKDNESVAGMLKLAIDYCKKRRLFTAINRPPTLYVSVDDFTHSKRLIIPFYNELNKIESYQSRSLFSDIQPKYLTKVGEKCFYGENNIDQNIPYLFVLEGPIDSMFVRNGIGMGGAKPTEKQGDFLRKHFDKKVIYIFDNDIDNKEMYKNITNHIEQGCSVFIWPKELSKFKDLNEVCCELGIDSVSTDFIVKNTFNGVEAAVKYKTLSRLR